MAREVLHTVLNQEALLRPIQIGIIEAHRDDAAMTGGFAEALADHPDVGISVFTLTDGAARNHRQYSSETMRLARRTEGPRSVAIMRGAQLICADIPGDGRLGEEVYRKEGEDFLEQVLDDVTPDFLIIPNLGDTHWDHRAAAEITQVVTEGKIPLYFMDTTNGTDRNGNPIYPTHAIPLEEKFVTRRRDSFMANTSQVTDLPHDEMGAVFDVLGMPGRRGRENGGGYAGVLVFDAKNSPRDPIAELYPGAVTLNNHMQLA